MDKLLAIWAWCSALIAAHPFAFGIVVWCVASLAVNYVFRGHSDEDLVAMADRTFVGALAIRLCRSLGLDPVGIVLWLRRLAEAKSNDGPPKPPSLPIKIVGGVLVALFLGGLAGCSWFTPAKGADALQIATCVLEHDGLPPAVIAEACAIEDLRQIEDILSASHNAAERHKSAICGPEAKP
jgi:hypothetical protein